MRNGAEQGVSEVANAEQATRRCLESHMITDIVGLREVRRPLRKDEWRGEHASAVVHATLDSWQLLDVLPMVKGALSELLSWIHGHGGSDRLELTVTWDETLLFVELHDRGGLIPEPHVSRVDAELAVRLLTSAAVEWGADLDSRGRRLWVAFSVPSTGLSTMPPDDRGWLR